MEQKKTNWRWLPVATVFALSLTLRTAVAAPPEANLPESTWFAASTQELKSLAEAWQRTSWGKFFAADAFVPLRDALKAERSASLLHLQPWLGFDWDRLSRFTGPATVAYVTRERAGGWILMLDAQANSELAQECLRVGDQYFSQAGFVKREVKLGENQSVLAFEYTPPGPKDKNGPSSATPTATGKSATPTKNGTEKAANSKSASGKAPATKKNAGKAPNAAATPVSEPRRLLCLTAQHLIVADSLEALEIVLARSADTPDSLHQSELFQQIAATTAKRSQQTRSDLQWFLRPFELWSAMDTQPKDRRKGQRDLLAAMKKQGFRGLKAVGGTVHFDLDDEISYYGTVVAPPPYKAAMRVLELIPGPLTMPPAWVAEDAATIQTANWNYRTAMSALGLLASELEDPQVPSAFEDTLDGLASSPDTGQVDVRKEIFDRLAKHVVIVSRFTKERSKKNPLGRQFLWIASPAVDENAEEGAAKKAARGLIDSLTRLLKNEENIAAQATPTQTLWYSNNGEQGGFLAPNSPIDGLLASEREIIVSTDQEYLKSLAKSRETSTPLSTHRDYTRFTERLAAWKTETAGYAFLNRTGLMMRTLFDALRSDQDLSESGMQSTLIRFALLGNSEATMAKHVPPFEKTGVSPQPLSGVAWPDKEIGFTFRGSVFRTPE